MYINKLIKKQVMLILATIVLVGTLAVTTSFAVFEETKSNATDQKMTIGDLDVTFTGGSAISITDINPMEDSTAFSQTNNLYTFSIKNYGTVPYNFKIKIINNPSYTSNLLPHQYIRYALYGGNTSSKDIGYTLGSGQDDYEINSGVIEAGDSLTYKLRLWVADASLYKLPNSALGQEIHLKISVEGKAGSGWITSNFKDRILAFNEVKTPLTTPGKEASTESEALLASTEDDYGTSYYFRGAVTNNYVQFANKCWRIVRIVGDGSVKLVLHNDNISGASNPCSAANNNTTAAFARYNGSTFTSEFNLDDDSYANDNAYVGFMYGTASSSDYASTHTNTNKSIILTNLEKWYTINLVSYESKLADTIWCNDKSTNSGDLGYGDDDANYSAYNRLFSTEQPTLKCLNDNNGGKLSKFTVNDTTNGNGNLTYKIGLLTVDEIAFSGSIGTQDSSSYLKENTGTTNWWTLSPGYCDGGPLGCVIIAGRSGRISDSYAFEEDGLRPAISLVSTVTATGTGTSEDPYVVQ